MKSIKNFLYFILEYLGIIEITFEIKSYSILVGVFLNYVFGKKILKLYSGQLVDKERLEFSIQRFLEKTSYFPIYVANLILPSEMFVSKLITVPKVNKSRLKNMVISNIESMGVFDISSLVYSYEVVGEYKSNDKTFIKVLISAIKSNLVSEYFDSFRSSGIYLKGVYPATIFNLDIFKEDLSSDNAVGIVVNKQSEVLVSIVKGDNIIRLEILEAVDRLIIESYIVNIISDFVKERVFFLEKILFLGFDYEFIEKIFDKVNIICISLDVDKKYRYLLENYEFIDIIGLCYTTPRIKLLPENAKKLILTDLVIFNVSFFLTIVNVVGFLIILLTQAETSNYLLFKRGIEGTGEVPDEVRKYTQVIELKNSVQKYEKFINSFYERFSNLNKVFPTLYMIFYQIDKMTFLTKVEVFPKSIIIKGYSRSNNSLYNTIKNLSTIDKLKNVKLVSVSEQSKDGRKLINFQLEVEL
ncbi:MAG: PilN domain-containing protein [Brevinematia bacterium]